MKNRIITEAGVFMALCAASSLSLAQISRPNPQSHTNGPPSVQIVTPGKERNSCWGTAFKSARCRRISLTLWHELSFSQARTAWGL